QTPSFPPDPILAAGPNHIVAAVNRTFAIFDKQGNNLFEVTAQDWFSNTVPGITAAPFDPQVIYDHYAERWVQVWVGGDLDTDPYYLISVSDDSNPLGTWCNYALPGNRNGSNLTFNWNDYPKMGFDSLAVYISANMFVQNNGPYDYTKIRIIPKSDLYNANCGPVTWTDFWDLRDPDNFQKHPDAIPIPAISFGTTSVHYMLGDSPFITGTFVTLWSISNPVNNPTLSAVNLPVTASFRPPGAQQLGGGTPPIEIFGRKFKNPPVIKDGFLWAAHDVAGGSNFEFGFARYLRIRLGLTSVIEDVAFGADDFWYFYPAVMVDDSHHLTMVFSRSGFSEYVGAGYTGRFDTDPPGLAPSTLLKEGEVINDNYISR
nr:hypothetical protein [candidate division Zixibacteria bacterium]NIT58985.1 hypothetical protein [Fodinibius sp.]NIW45563.1 hypothetical protein [Gammaproteobacteria bacterium]NIS47223.1 hypothetical protein [candidate division Zixibacteria bacterium]NIU13524.1 hypothetical protein [candidate division Zixibacteria bacterium]